MQCQGQRGVLEIRFANAGTFMFHAHQSEFTELGWMGYFQVERVARGSRLHHRGAGRRLAPLGRRPDRAARARRRRVRARTATGSSTSSGRARRPPTSSTSAASSSAGRDPRARPQPAARPDHDRRRHRRRRDRAVHADGPHELGRLRSTTLVVPYDWVDDEPLAIGVTSSTGIQTTTTVAAAVATPQASARGFLGYGLVGFFVGVVPVALGLLWLPSLRRLDARWLGAFMALTCGLLTFLGVEALFESFELQAGLPGALGGPGLVLLGVALAALGMTFVSGRLGTRPGATGLALALLVAIGIGVHNLGEGLAIGTSFALGELQLGRFL